MWYLTSNKNIHFDNIQCIREKDFVFYYSNDIQKYNNQKVNIFVDGHIQYRSGISPAFKESLIILYEKYGPGFIQYIKGEFTCIILKEDSFEIYSDHLGIKKYFYTGIDPDFHISNDFRMITSQKKCEISTENIALYLLFYHFIAGKTIFKDIFSNKGSQLLSFSGKKISITSHWNYNLLETNTFKKVPIETFRSLLESNLKNQLNFRNSHKLSLSLTAGMDSRVLLSLLKRMNVSFHTYTYGDPESLDCKCAGLLSENTSLEHHLYPISFTPQSFEKYANLSVKMGNGLVSLHRAHRLYAIEKESEKSRMMILGIMGGEFIKGTKSDNYTLSKLIFEPAQNINEDKISLILSNLGLNLNFLDSGILLDIIRSQPWYSDPERADFHALFEISASLHHAQNEMQYNQLIPEIILPFLDLDYLELLFSSHYNFWAKKDIPNWKKRILNSDFASAFICNSFPQISQITFDNGVKPSEFCRNMYYSSLRAIQRKRRYNYPPNFPLTDFMYHFTRKNLREIREKQNILGEIFHIDFLLNDLEMNKSARNEASWLKYTNPIQMQLILNNFA